ncbi:hypothetical protein JTB14_013374 [Gonioctena quinquepunctata]|nr:hypothetical protein JTB14_013374 [Gonioctena quinquepunctata]
MIEDRVSSDMISIKTLEKTVAARWKNKEDKYRRELKKIPKPRSGDPGNSYKSTWPYFPMMTFLKDLMTSANKSGNLPTNNSQQEEDNDIDIVEEEELGSTNTQDEEISLQSPQSVPAASIASPQEEG